MFLINMVSIGSHRKIINVVTIEIKHNDILSKTIVGLFTVLLPYHFEFVYGI